MDKMVNKNNAELAPISGLENMDSEDIAMPTLYVDGKMGIFRNSLDEKEKKDQVKGVLLTYNKGWKYREGDPPVTKCRSFDGQTGTFGTSCEGCPRRVKQPDSKDFCKRVYDFLFLPEGESMPYILSITQVTSLGEVKKYLTLFAKKLKQPLFSAKSVISLEKTKNKQGYEYFKVKFEKGEDLSQDTQAKLEEIMRLYRFKKSQEGEEVDVESDLEDPSAPF